MRWFIVFLVLANIGLYLWVEQDSRSSLPVAVLPPPDLGRLQLVTENAEKRIVEGVLPDGPETANAEPSASEPVAPIPAAASAKSEQPVDEAVAVPVSIVEEPPAPSPEPFEEEGLTAVTATEPEESPLPALQSGAPDSDRTFDETPSAPPVEQPVCARVGPLTGEQADDLVANLPVYVKLLSDMTEETPKVDGYYVMIPALPSAGAGRKKLEALAAAGVTDTWLFRGGPFRNAISLGLFRRQGSAVRHANNVTKKGFNPQVLEKTSLREMRWLALQNVDGGDLALTLPVPEGAEVKPQGCPLP